MIARAIAWGVIAWGLLLCVGLVHAAEPEQVVAELLLELGFKGPPPAITWVDAQQVVEACNCRPPAFYRDNTAYLSRAIDLDDPWGRSQLLHELVHHVQVARHGPVRDCQDWRDREMRAYAIQNQWLQDHGVGRRAIFSGACQ